MLTVYFELRELGLRPNVAWAMALNCETVEV